LSFASAAFLSFLIDTDQSKNEENAAEHFDVDLARRVAEEILKFERS
jgi:hypothetical protein